MSQHSVKFDEDGRHATYLRDAYKCQYCGHHDATHTGIGLSLDHIDSRASGGAAQNGKHDPKTNVVTACHACNFAKQDKTPREWGAYIKSRGIKVNWGKVRSQAQKPLDIKAGEQLAQRARDARAARAGILAAATEKYAPSKSGAAVPAAPGGGGGGDPCHDELGHFTACRLAVIRSARAVVAALRARLTER